MPLLNTFTSLLKSWSLLLDCERIAWAYLQSKSGNKLCGLFFDHTSAISHWGWGGLSFIYRICILFMFSWYARTLICTCRYAYKPMHVSETFWFWVATGHFSIKLFLKILLSLCNCWYSTIIVINTVMVISSSILPEITVIAKCVAKKT